MEQDDFTLPELTVGDKVLWHDNPTAINRNTACSGIISRRPGKFTVAVLIWAEESGWVEKMSVRHKDDPFWRTADTAQSWMQWGCFELHPETEALRELRPLITRLKLEAAKLKKPEKETVA